MSDRKWLALSIGADVCPQPRETTRLIKKGSLRKEEFIGKLSSRTQYLERIQLDRMKDSELEEIKSRLQEAMR